mmetsp:Transcript_116431/g.290767  ORF Transcript_116431/g.290767 Transcript_116431/m.290767 type:complete len:299 (-) Transcript_116431:14-910(-)
MRLAKQQETEDTESSGAETDSSDEEFWDWYESEDRDFDSLMFPPGFFFCGGEGQTASELSFDGTGSASLPRRQHAGQTHCWDDAEIAGVKVRSQAYLQNGVKEQSAGSMLELRIVDLFRAEGSHDDANYSESSGSAVRRLREDGDDRFLFVLNFRLQPLQLAIAWAAPEEPAWKATPSGQLFYNFCKAMHNNERNSRLKLLAKVVDGPWLVKACLPPKPVLIGQQCPVTYFESERYIEASISCESSSLGRKLSQMLSGGSCVVALYVLVEGKTEDELPERVLGGATLHHTDAAKLSTR